ncbi:MAG: PEGA domain-containing protein [Deltaproteobacteria bacterium]|nr:PEGA domain-containing protein [Deltaproteobacteria bacterium]
MGAKIGRLIGVCVVALLACAMVVTHTSSVEAQPKKAAAGDTKKEAIARYKEADALFKKDDFASALPVFVEADRLYPGAAPKHKIAVCYDKLGKAAEAVAAYRTFIDSKPSVKYAERVTDATKRIAELEPALPATVTLQIVPEGLAGVVITVDGTPAQGPDLQLEAGEHTVVVTAEGHDPVTEVVNVRGAETRDLAVTLTPSAASTPPPPPPPPEAPEEDEGGSNVPAYVTLGIAGAGVILGTVFGIQALGAKSDFDDQVEDPAATPSELTDLADKAERAALIADMSFGVALTFGITGAVLLFSSGGDD